MSDVLDAIVVGAGYAGLGVSYFLKQNGIAHRVIERARIGETWRTQRWNSFLLNSSNLRSMLPGDIYSGQEPWGAISHHEFVAYMEEYTRRNRLPVIPGTAAIGLTWENGVFRLTTSAEAVEARTVIVATGNLNVPVRPEWSKELPATVRQIDCSDYSSAGELQTGAVLVVGSGQSGGQVAEDLVIAGRTVFLATGRVGRIVRRYRGGDTLNWLTLSGFSDVPRRQLADASGKLPPRGLIGATHTLSLQSLSAQGVILLGRFLGVEGGKLRFGDDVKENMRFADEASAHLKRFIDQYIETTRIDAPAAEDDPAEVVQPQLPNPPIRYLDPEAANLTSLIWCTGFIGDYGWIRIAGALDGAGQPLHEEGVSTVPGLYFPGLDYSVTRKSGTIPAIAEEAAAIVDHLLSRPFLRS